jgi:hypothetical protein
VAGSDPNLSSLQSHSLPASQHYETFLFIDKVWRYRESTRDLTEQFRNAVLGLPTKVRIDAEIIARYKLKDKTRDNPLRAFLAKYWRFLRLAVSRVVRHRLHPGVAPYAIMRRFFDNLGRPRTAEDLVIAEIETLDGGDTE